MRFEGRDKGKSKSKFNYCPSIWMFCGEKGAKLLNDTHKRALRAVIIDFFVSLNNLLQISNSNFILKRRRGYLTGYIKQKGINLRRTPN